MSSWTEIRQNLAAAAAHGAVWPSAQMRSSTSFWAKVTATATKTSRLTLKTFKKMIPPSRRKRKRKEKRSLTDRVHGQLMGQEVAQWRRALERKCGYSEQLLSALACCQAAGQRCILLLRRPPATSSCLSVLYSALIKYSFSKTRHLCNQYNKRVSTLGQERAG